jgi:hypothetical protein
VIDLRKRRSSRVKKLLLLIQRSIYGFLKKGQNGKNRHHTSFKFIQIEENLKKPGNKDQYCYLQDVTILILVASGGVSEDGRE